MYEPNYAVFRGQPTTIDLSQYIATPRLSEPDLLSEIVRQAAETGDRYPAQETLRGAQRQDLAESGMPKGEFAGRAAGLLLQSQLSRLDQAVAAWQAGREEEAAELEDRLYAGILAARKFMDYLGGAPDLARSLEDLYDVRYDINAIEFLLVHESSRDAALSDTRQRRPAREEAPGETFFRRTTPWLHAEEEEAGRPGPELAAGLIFNQAKRNIGALDPALWQGLNDWLAAGRSIEDWRSAVQEEAGYEGVPWHSPAADAAAAGAANALYRICQA